MAHKQRINPALIAALEHYAEGRYDPMRPSMYVHTDAKHHQSPWPIERACGIAAEVMATEELNFIRFKVLKDGMKTYGMQNLYEKIMGEKFDA